MMGDDKQEDLNKVFKWPNKRHKHVNLGSANFIGLEPNLTHPPPQFRM